jgi:hypothetical protein
MNVGLLPLADQRWLWPRTGFAWRRIGPMMPGEHPVEMLAEHLAHAPVPRHRRQERSARLCCINGGRRESGALRGLGGEIEGFVDELHFACNLWFDQDAMAASIMCMISKP